MLWLTRLGHHPEILVYLLQLFMFVMIKRGYNSYALDKYHITCQQFQHAQVTIVVGQKC